MVVGGGLAGLAAAWRLQKSGVCVRLIERSDRLGGVVGSKQIDGYLFERGPTTVPAASPTLRGLIQAAGLQDRALLSNPASQRRYIWSRGCLRELPTGLAGLLRSDLISLRGKFRLLGEPFIGRLAAGRDETLAELCTRRLGAEVVAALTDPLVCGVFAGRPEELGSDAFPRLKEMEQQHGSLFRALWINRNQHSRQKHSGSLDESMPRHALISFPMGMQELTEALGRSLSDCVQLDMEAVTLERLSGRDRGWQVEVRGLHTNASPRRIKADAVILAVTAPAATQLLEPLVGAAANNLRCVPHAPVAVVGLGYSRGAVGHSLDGFGLLCASDSPLRTSGPILGVLFTSSLFPGRAPADGVSLTVMLGGTRDPEALLLSDSALVDRAHDSCRELLDIKEAPQVTSITRWPHAIPQYLPGHLRRIDDMERRIEVLGRLRLAGSYLRGVGVEATVRSGIKAAESLVERYPSLTDA